MTGNQIAWAGLQEDKRHNQATEGEVNRHNVETENLEAWGNQIKSETNRINQLYNDKKLQLEQEYNSWYMKWTTSSGTTKLRIENELKDIKDRQQRADQDWYTQQSELRTQEIALQSARNEETKRHDEALETIEAAKVHLNFEIENKRLEYQNTWERWQQDVRLINADTESAYKLGTLQQNWELLPYTKMRTYQDAARLHKEATGFPMLAVPFYHSDTRLFNLNKQWLSDSLSMWQ
jgi:hypothetical protein